MSFEGQQQKIEHNGSRKKFSAYISMLWPDMRLMYDFYDVMNYTKHYKPSGESEEICDEDYMEKTDTDMG